MAEPYTIGAQATWRGEVGTGDTVLIQGAGPIGICILKFAKLQGASVMMTDLSEERLAFAQESGADVTVQAGRKMCKSVYRNGRRRRGQCRHRCSLFADDI